MCAAPLSRRAEHMPCLPSSVYTFVRLLTLVFDSTDDVDGYSYSTSTNLTYWSSNAFLFNGYDPANPITQTFQARRIAASASNDAPLVIVATRNPTFVSFLFSPGFPRFSIRL